MGPQPLLHARALFEHFTADPRLFDFIPIPPLQTLTEFCTFLELFRCDPGRLLFAIFDQSVLPASEPPTALSRLAGMIGVDKTDTSARSTEIGAVFIFSDFQRSHVLTHAATLVLRWAFDVLRLRRVQWFTDERNTASVNSAKRLGLKLEAHLSWERVLPLGKDGVEPPEWARAEEAQAGRGRGRHSILLAIGWDEWRNAGKENLGRLVEREVKTRTLVRTTSGA